MGDAPSRPAAATRECAGRLAAAVAGLGDGEWLDRLEALGAAVPAGTGAAPTFEALATAGADVVEALAGEGRWADAADQAARLRRVFAAQRHTLHPVAGEAFDGLHAATLAREAQELDDFVDLIRVMFDGTGPPGG